MVQCLSFSKAVFGDFEILTKQCAYANYRAAEYIIALAIPFKPFLAILNEQYPDLKKEIFAKVSNKHRQIKKTIKEKV